MIGRRIVRAVVWGAVTGGGLAAGLAAGSSVSSTPIDAEMLIQLGGGAGAIAALLGLLLPMKGRPAR